MSDNFHKCNESSDRFQSPLRIWLSLSDISNFSFDAQLFATRWNYQVLRFHQVFCCSLNKMWELKVRLPRCFNFLTLETYKLLWIIRCHKLFLEISKVSRSTLTVLVMNCFQTWMLENLWQRVKDCRWTDMVNLFQVHKLTMLRTKLMQRVLQENISGLT